MRPVSLLRRPSQSVDAKRPRGQSLVEFALVFPVVLFLLLIAIDFGRIYLGWINLEQMTRIAANYAADHAKAWGTPGNPGDRATYQNQIIQDAHAINCTPQNPIPDPIIAGGSAPSLGSMVSVSISCEFQVLTPVISNVLGGTILVTAESSFPVKDGAVGLVPGGGGPITTMPEAKFDASPVSGWAPLTVSFSDISTGAPTSWIWDFSVAPSGSGTGGVNPGTAITQGPHSVTYDCTGAVGATCTFGVSLQVANAAGADTELKSSLVTVTVPPTTGPIAEFTGSPLSGVEPLTTAFQFVDVRAGAVTYTNFEWDFTGNGTYDATGATLTSTSHTYSTSGSYDVTLRVTDNTGAQSTLTKAVYVIVGRRTCTVPDFFNTKRNDAQSRWAAAGFTTTVITQPPKNGGGNANYNIGYQSIVGGLIDPQPAGCASVITVGP